MDIKDKALGAAFAVLVSAIGYAGSTFIDMTSLLSTNSTKLEIMRGDLEYLREEVTEQGKDIAAIKAELAEEEVAALPMNGEYKGG